MNIHFDWLAPIYEKYISPPDPAQLAARLNLPTDGWLLDAGGGTGRVAGVLRQQVGRLVITDLSGPMLHQSRAKTDVYGVNGRAEALPFPTESFDRILIVDALHHFQHQKAAIGCLLSRLKPGGVLVIEEPDIAHFGVKLVALAEKLALMGSHFHSPVQIKTIVESFGVPARIVHDGSFAAWVVAQKPPAP